MSNEKRKINFVPVGNGAIAIGPRLGKRSFPALKTSGCTHVVTILSNRENAEGIGERVKRRGIEWLWIPLGSASPAEADLLLPEIRTTFEELSAVIDQGGRCYVHCSAGQHRTGMIVNAWLRFIGYDEQGAFRFLERLRPITAQEVGEHRLAWGANFAPLA